VTAGQAGGSVVVPDRSLQVLSRIMACARTEEDMRVLLEGLLTPQEHDEVVLRWRLLVMLAQGQTQREIARKLGISLGKIARGSRLLQYGRPAFRRLIEAAAAAAPDSGEAP
jgi:TrpR family trp operon transcriptional repressor